MVVAFKDTVDAYEHCTHIEGEEDVLEKLERLILEHIPQSIAETIAMLGVLIPNVEAGARVDGADLKALENIRTFLEGHP